MSAGRLFVFYWNDIILFVFNFYLLSYSRKTKYSPLSLVIGGTDSISATTNTNSYIYCFLSQCFSQQQQQGQHKPELQPNHINHRAVHKSIRAVKYIRTFAAARTGEVSNGNESYSSAAQFPIYDCFTGKCVLCSRSGLLAIKSVPTSDINTNVVCIHYYHLPRTFRRRVRPFEARSFSLCRREEEDEDKNALRRLHIFSVVNKSV